MRCITVALVSVLAATPAFAGGHGHAVPRDATETIPRAPKANDDVDKSFRVKKSPYEKTLQATEREGDQFKGYKMKGLTHPAFEASDLSESGKGARDADAREAPAPKIKANGNAAIGPPAVHVSASSAAAAAAH
jgi:hypothetical protein